MSNLAGSPTPSRPPRPQQPLTTQPPAAPLPATPHGAPPAPQGAGHPTVAQLRHKAEIPLLVLGVVLTIVAVLVVLYLLISDIPLNDVSTGILIGLAAPMLAFFMIRYQYWSKISDGVEVTPQQFPEMWNVYQSLLPEMGFTDSEGIMAPPRLYIFNGNGLLNAFASKCRVRQGYVVLYSDIVDIAYVHNNFDFLRFVLAHELGHIKCGHVNLWRIMVRPVMEVLRLNPSLTRAQEYTADRVALYYAPEQAEAMIYLYAGKYCGSYVDMDEYFRSVANHKENIWLKISNFMADHAIGYRRLTAIRAARHVGWDVHGKML